MASPDLSISWLPANVQLGNLLPVQFSGFTGVTSITCNNTASKGIFFEDLTDLVSLSYPNLTSIAGFGNTDFITEEAVQIWGLTSLTTLSFPSLQTWQGGGWLRDLDSLTSLSFPSLTTIDLTADASVYPNQAYCSITIDRCNVLASISLSALTTIIPSAGSIESFISINTNPLLTTIDISSLTYPDNIYFGAYDNALNQATVDAILAKAVANPACVVGVIEINGGTNSAPSASGLADKATLIGRGLTVLTN